MTPPNNVEFCSLYLEGVWFPDKIWESKGINLRMKFQYFSLYLQPLLKLVYKSNIYSRNGWRYRRRTMCSGQVYRQNTSGERMNLAYHIQKSWHVSAALHQISILISHNYLLGFSLIIIDVYWEDFNFPIVNFSLICSTIPAAPAYGAYSSQLIRYSRACGSYQDSLIEECC
jgi:hypothetical protein